MNTTEIGNLYEEYILKILEKEYDHIWLTKNVPSEIIKKCNLQIFNDIITCDIGFDIIAVKNDIITFIQCKNYTNIICQSDLCGFYTFVAHNYNDKNKYIVYYNGKLSNKIQLHIGLSTLQNNVFVTRVGEQYGPQRTHIEYINISFNNYISENIETLNLVPKYYQICAYDILKGNKKAILNMPCGMGKTYISYLLSQDYDNIILVSPLRIYAQNILNTFKSYLNNDTTYKYSLISSDTKRIVPILGLKNIISVTYDSCDIINTFINTLGNIFIIIDECHNLSEKDVNGNTEIGKLLLSTYNTLFVSATPKNNIEKIFPNIAKYLGI